MESKIQDIINKNISEKNWLDYKAIEYDSCIKSRNKLFKEVIGMLNSEESYKDDKFIIMGVNDEGDIIGIDRARDDNEYQNEFDNIYPRPSIEKAETKINDKVVSYLHISKSNIERPYVVGKDLELGKYTLSKGVSFIRKGTKNYPLEEDERSDLIFKTMAYKPGNTELVRQINADIKFKESEFHDTKVSGSRTINPSHNNGKFIFGYNEYKFTIKFESASNKLGRIYSDYDDIRVGKITNRDYLIQTFDLSIDRIDFSSRVVGVHSNEVGVAVNQYGKVIFLEFLVVESQSHGKTEDKITFKWYIVDYKNK